MPHKCAQPIPDVRIHKRQGLCISVVVFCNNCKFKSESIDMFETVKAREGKPGPKEGALNKALSVPMLKTKCGPSDISFFF